MYLIIALREACELKCDAAPPEFDENSQKKCTYDKFHLPHSNHSDGCKSKRDVTDVQVEFYFRAVILCFNRSHAAPAGFIYKCEDV